MTESQTKPSRVLVTQEIATHYTIRMHREITDPDDFDEEFLVLSEAGPSDVVCIDLSTIGGSVETAILLMRAIRQCQAVTIANIGPECSSAGSAIALACDHRAMDEYSSMMVHTASFGVSDSAPQLESQVIHRLKMIRKFVSNVYRGFLTEDEIELVLSGKEFWLEGEDLRRRLEGYDEYRQQVLDSLEEEE